MTKDEAISRLEDYLMERADESCSSGFPILLPKEDQVICKEIAINPLKGHTEFIDWTFKGLIKLAYDL